MSHNLRVTLSVDEDADIELTANEKVRLYRQRHSETDGDYLERHGDLLPPGTAKVHLERGVYHFRTLNDAELSVVRGGVTVHSATPDSIKHPWPTPGSDPIGSEPPGPAPSLKVTYHVG